VPNIYVASEIYGSAWKFGRNWFAVKPSKGS